MPLHPIVAQYGYDIDGSTLWWRVVSFIQLNIFLAARGIVFFLIVVYIMVALLLFNVMLCIWVGWSFQSNSFDHVW